MESKVLGLYLLLPASLALLGGCVQTESTTEDTAADADDTEQVGEAEAACHGTWADAAVIPGITGCGTPALSACGADLCMMYSGCGYGGYGHGADAVYFSRYNGTAWAAGVAVPGIVAGVTPTLGAWGNGLVAVYPHYGTNRLMASFWDGHVWGAAAAIGDGIYSPYAPSIATFNRNLYVGYRGHVGNRLYLTAYDGNVWGAPHLIDGAYSIGAPSLLAYGNRLNAFWPGANSQIYMSAWDGNRWGSPYGLDGIYAPGAPGVGIYQNAINAVYPLGTGLGTGLGVGLGTGLGVGLGTGLGVGLGTGLGVRGYGLGWTQYADRAWLPGATIPGITAAYAPGVAMYRNGFHMVYAGMDNKFYWSHLR